MSRKSIEMSLQENLLEHLGKSYLSFVLTVKVMLINGTTNLLDTILHLIHQAEINKRNEEDIPESPGKVLITRSLQAPRETYTSQECMTREITTHFLSQCLIELPELWTKFTLCHIKMHGLNQSLKKAATSAQLKQKETLTTLEIESWQPKILAIERPQKNYWLVDSVANIHVYNDRVLMREYQKLPTRIGSSTSNRIFPGRGRIRLRFALKHRSNDLVLNFCNVYYLPNSLSNLIILGLLNDSEFFYDN